MGSTLRPEYMKEEQYKKSLSQVYKFIKRVKHLDLRFPDLGGHCRIPELLVHHDRHPVLHQHRPGHRPLRGLLGSHRSLVHRG